MNRVLVAVAVILCITAFVFTGRALPSQSTQTQSTTTQFQPGQVLVQPAMKMDVSAPLSSMRDSGTAIEPADCGAESCGDSPEGPEQQAEVPPAAPPPVLSAAGTAVEQTTQGSRPPVPLVVSFEGMGSGFTGEKGNARFGNPSDSSLAVGPNHIVQVANARLAIYTKKGARYPQSGTVLYGAAAMNSLFTGFGGVCEARNNGDTVVRYDQLANRWLFVMPIFSPILPDQFTGNGELLPPGQPVNPGPAVALPSHPVQPPVVRPHHVEAVQNAIYAMCYAVSTSDDPLGTYYRYAFKRTLFPDYPRPAVWPDGYYVPSSTGDNVIQKHACVVDRVKMLAGQPATEQCIIIDGVSFLNNSDVDGQNLPPAGAPNIMMADGGTQLKKIFDDDGIYYWKFHVDWDHPENTKATGPEKITVAPYHFLCNGQLNNCVPQPGTDRGLDAQGDKLMQRLVYRKIGHHEFLAVSHSVDTKAGGGGVRWYEFRLDKQRNPVLYQQGTYAPEGFYRWMPSIAMDKKGDIGVGYSYGGTPNFAGQRFAARLANDPKGQLTFHETVLATGAASQTNTLRWEDYVTTAMDPSDDCTFWYTGDYFKAGDTSYSSKIGAFRVPKCH
jgi:hypothetical protein